MRQFTKYLKRINSVGTPLFSIGWTPSADDLDPELVDELAAILESPDIEDKVAGGLILYYGQQASLPSGTALYQGSGRIYPIIVREEWISNPAQTPDGLKISLVLQGRRGVVHYPELAREYRQALKSLNREVHDNPAYAVESIMNDSNGITLGVKLAHYFDYVFTAQILDAELRLNLAHGAAITERSLKHRSDVGVLNFDHYMAKVGLNVLVAFISDGAPAFLLMDRSTMVMKRPLEYPNSVHVVPAGTVQPSGQEMFDDDDLSLSNTLVREWAEELFNNDSNEGKQLANDLVSGNAKFVLTAMGIDALTQKIEICGLLMVFRPVPFRKKASNEGLIRAVDRKELQERAFDVNRVLPAGALAIWEGLGHLDQSVDMWRRSKPAA